MNALLDAVRKAITDIVGLMLYGRAREKQGAAEEQAKETRDAQKKRRKAADILARRQSRDDALRELQDGRKTPRE